MIAGTIILEDHAIIFKAENLDAQSSNSISITISNVFSDEEETQKISFDELSILLFFAFNSHTSTNPVITECITKLYPFAESINFLFTEGKGNNNLRIIP